MKERPILFNGDMVRAILDGRKTQTRRVVKPQPGSDNRIPWPGRKNIVANIRDERVLGFCPYGQPGDRLWVRETWAMSGYQRVEYRAAPADGSDFRCVDRWRPSIHMPRWACRITLEITGVRVERLQEISEKDAKAEGLHYHSDMYGYRLYGKYSGIGPTDDVGALDAFRSLWESINGPSSWDATPWVWVIEFKRRDG